MAQRVDERPELPPANAAKLPRWRGFNLPCRIRREARPGHLNKPFTEASIRQVAELGFNFVRLPVDYRYWIEDGDWSQIDEESPVLAEIDRMVGWGGKYGVHVCINFHTAPGYCVNDKTPEGSRLWIDPEAQRVCAQHWAFFAGRYRGIPNARLSFNLWNEPNRTDAETHLRVTRRVVEAIRAEDPGRLIICDGFKFAPAPELVELGVAQAGRGYKPGEITHFRAKWYHGSDRWSIPVWPRPQASGWLTCQPKHESAGKPLTITGPFDTDSTLVLRVGDVWSTATMVVQIDGREVLRREFFTGPEGQGPWKAATYYEQWKAYQCTYDEDISVRIPAGAKEIRIVPVEGFWLQVTRLTHQAAEVDDRTIDLDTRWGTPASTLRFDAGTRTWIAPHMQDRQWLWDNHVKPWLELADKNVGVMIGEFGVYNKTPHDVALAFLEDCLVNYRKAGLGWALWNFDGPFGILDSERADVEYEDWNGHKLDRKMLELLQLH